MVEFDLLIIIMHIDFRRNNSESIDHDLDYARQLSKKMAAKNKQLKYFY